jgi:outer membrane lipoprotein-sorting protein
MRDRAWWLRVVSPPVVVGAVIAVAAIGIPADATPSLPTKTAQQLLTMVTAGTDVAVSGISGDVAETASLGLPSLPSGTGGSGSGGLTGLLSGTHALRVWIGKAGQFRAQVLDTLDETDVVSDSTDLYTYVYSTNTVTHIALPTKHGSGSSGGSGGSDTATSPATAASLAPSQLATSLLNAINPSTDLSFGGTAKVAGHDTYLLDVRPRTADTTVGLVQIALDSATGVALRVQIFAQGASSAAFTIGFTKVSFAAINASQFHFTPPPGAQNSAGTAFSKGAPSSAMTAPTTKQSTAPTARPYVIGTGWSTVLVLPRAALTPKNPQPQTQRRGRGGQAESLASALADAGVRVDGGTLLQTNLLNVLSADDGRLLIGAVPLATLEKALHAPTPTG